MNPDISCLTATRAVELMRTGQLTSMQVVQSVLENVKKYNKDVNAVVTLNEQEALRCAAQADGLLLNENNGPLHGVPVTVKDFYRIAGIRSTAGMEKYRDYVPAEDAAIVARLRQAGAIILGKTNMPPMAMDCQTDNALFGRTSNPWDLSKTSGGSSGGGAAAVASGMSYLDVGNDLLGSVRIPAGFCGVCSIVPTEKLVPNSGLIIDKPENAVIGRMMRAGLMARSVRDLKTGLRVISGPDEGDADGIPLSRLADCNPAGKLKIAWTATAGGLPVSEEVGLALETFSGKLMAAGYDVEPLKDGSFDFSGAREVFLQLFYPLTALHMPPLIRFLARTLGGAKYLDLSMKRFIAAMNRRLELIGQFERLMREYDVLLCPVTATPAFPHMKPDRNMGGMPVYAQGIDVDGVRINYAQANMGFTIPFSVTGNPVATIPVGFTKGGLPVSMQAVGKRYEELRLLDMAEIMMQLNDEIRYPFMRDRSQI